MLLQTPTTVLAAMSTVHRPAFLDRVDPRLRILVAVAYSVLVVMAYKAVALGFALAAVLLAMGLSNITPRHAVRRLLPVNAVLLMLAVVLPLTTPGTPLVQLGPLVFSHEGLLQGLSIAVKGNAIVLALLILIWPLDAGTLGHALRHLHVPRKLVHLLLFTARYIDVLENEVVRLRAAMKVRGFRPRMNRHTYRAYGHLVGMLLVRSFDRAERIAAAMKCRGFRGEFPVLDHFHYSRYDIPFILGSLVLLAVLTWIKWA